MEDLLTLSLNLMGTFAFGLSRGILGVRKQMDLSGVLVLSVATGLGGGITRDIVLGHTPLPTLSDWRYLVAETEIVTKISKDPAQASRTWVLLTEAAEGGWGIAGTAYGKKEFAELAAKAVAARAK